MQNIINGQSDKVRYSSDVQWSENESEKKRKGYDDWKKITKNFVYTYIYIIYLGICIIG